MRYVMILLNLEGLRLFSLMVRRPEIKSNELPFLRCAYV